jgi:hypothetical protein
MILQALIHDLNFNSCSLVMGSCFIAMALYLNQGCQSFQVTQMRDEKSSD